MKKIETIVYSSLLIIVILFVAFIVMASFKEQFEIGTMEVNCCGSNTCSDTYYTFEDNKCHLSLCENSIFTDKSKCVYEGKNITLEVLN